ncbi:MAG: hypothetical protein WBP64_22060 [Nitrososphaeraceae archaeon]
MTRVRISIVSSDNNNNHLMMSYYLFYKSTYEAAATCANWNRQAVERQ